jgi:hypothetical protein
MRNALSATPTVYQHFLSNPAAQPMAGLFELNVYDVLADAFPAASSSTVTRCSSKPGDPDLENHRQRPSNLQPQSAARCPALR